MMPRERTPESAVLLRPHHGQDRTAATRPRSLAPVARAGGEQADRLCSDVPAVVDRELKRWLKAVRGGADPLQLIGELRHRGRPLLSIRLQRALLNEREVGSLRTAATEPSERSDGPRTLVDEMENAMEPEIPFRPHTYRRSLTRLALTSLILPALLSAGGNATARTDDDLVLGQITVQPREAFAHADTDPLIRANEVLSEIPDRVAALTATADAVAAEVAAKLDAYVETPSAATESELLSALTHAADQLSTAAGELADSHDLIQTTIADARGVVAERVREVRGELASARQRVQTSKAALADVERNIVALRSRYDLADDTEVPAELEAAFFEVFTAHQVAVAEEGIWRPAVSDLEAQLDTLAQADADYREISVRARSLSVYAAGVRHTMTELARSLVVRLRLVLTNPHNDPNSPSTLRTRLGALDWLREMPDRLVTVLDAATRAGTHPSEATTGTTTAPEKPGRGALMRWFRSVEAAPAVAQDDAATQEPVR